MHARMVWESLLSGHIANKRTRKQTRSEHTKHLYSQVASFGDNELMLSGLFENINNLRLGDTSMVKSAKALDAMVDADIFQGAGFKKGHFHLQPCVASTAMGVHACVSNTRQPPTSTGHSRARCTGRWSRTGRCSAGGRLRASSSPHRLIRPSRRRSRTS